MADNGNRVIDFLDKLLPFLSVAPPVADGTQAVWSFGAIPWNCG